MKWFNAIIIIENKKGAVTMENKDLEKKIEELEKAYKMVFDDMKKNAPPFFFGICDTRGEKDLFMDGVQTVVEYITLWADLTGNLQENFSKQFEKNMKKSRRKNYNK